MHRILGTVFCLVFTLSTFGSLPGQVDDEAKGGVRYKEKTILDIDEGIDIEGSPDRPGLEKIEGHGPRDFDSLIKLRTNFERELLRSVNEL